MLYAYLQLGGADYGIRIKQKFEVAAALSPVAALTVKTATDFRHKH